MSLIVAYIGSENVRRISSVGKQTLIRYFIWSVSFSLLIHISNKWFNLVGIHSSIIFDLLKRYINTLNWCNGTSTGSMSVNIDIISPFFILLWHKRNWIRLILFSCFITLSVSSMTKNDCPSSLVSLNALISLIFGCSNISLISFPDFSNSCSTFLFSLICSEFIRFCKFSTSGWMCFFFCF